MDPKFTISALVFLPALSALVLACVPLDSERSRLWALLTTAVTFVYSVFLFTASGTQFDANLGNMQASFSVPWIESFDIDYFMGIDGISLPLVILTTFVSLLAMAASTSKSITKHMKAYCVLFLLLETGMIGVFLALDFFLFYIFWEVMLLPMYFLIGIWGGPRREYAAIKFFLYTLFGSVLMLIAILMLYFNSDLTQLTPTQLADCKIHDSVQEKVKGNIEDAAKLGPAAVPTPVHTFNLLALMQVGQTTDCFNDTLLFGWSLQTWAFLLLFIGFAIKVPSVPVHTWLPDAHVEAPTPISMILAGVLLKMGGYGIIRICYPICPEGGYQLAWFVCAIGVISMIYGAFAALAQKDFKRLVAYSSVSHMGYVVVGFGVWSASAPFYNSDYWNMGINGAMFQMIGHGVSSAGMFFMVGVVYDRVHHRNLDEFGGLFSKMPVYSGLAIGLFFAGLGLPGLCGFIGEVLVVLSIWNFSKTLAILSAAVVILTAGYILWTLQRVYLGAEYRGPHEEALTPSTLRENVIAGTLLAFAILLGVLPYHTVLRFMEKTVDAQVDSLTVWQSVHDSQNTLGADAAEDLSSAAPGQTKSPAPVPQSTSATNRQPIQRQPRPLAKVSLADRPHRVGNTE
jgi:NADH-quinone oxidoreductase subunit M